MSGLLGFLGGMGQNWADTAAREDQQMHAMDLRELDYQLDVKLKEIQHEMNMDMGEVKHGYATDLQEGRIAGDMAGRRFTAGATASRQAAAREANVEEAKRKENMEMFNKLSEQQDLEDWQEKNPDVRVDPKGKVISEKSGGKPTVLKKQMLDHATGELVNTPYAYLHPDTLKVVPLPNTFGGPQSGGAPVTMEDVEYTAKMRNKTVLEVIQALEAAGVTVVR